MKKSKTEKENLTRRETSLKKDKEEFKKFDEGKLRYDLIPPIATEEMAYIMAMGAKKYGDNNWKLADNPQRYLAALLRHIELYRMGIEVDVESGRSHLAHALTNIAFLLELNHTSNKFDVATEGVHYGDIIERGSKELKD